MKRLTGNSKLKRDKKVLIAFKSFQCQYPFYKYTEICIMTGRVFKLGMSSVRKIIENN